jgi:hypothetical protein
MSDLDRLLEAFESGALLRPDAADPNFIDLVRAVAALAGVEDLERSPNSETMSAVIGQPEHLAFVLADGLGTPFIEDELGPKSWLAQHLVQPIRSVYPSTTSAAITSLATGCWPGTHSVAGWWNYLPQLAEPVVILPFLRLSDGARLDTFTELTVAEAIPLPPLMQRMTRDVALFQPRAIVDSAYSTYLGGDAERIPYGNLSEAVSGIARRIHGAARPTYTYWYVPNVDHQAHEHGCRSPQVRTALLELDSAVASLAKQLEGSSSRIVLTADHGHVDAGTKIPLAADDPLCDHLRSAPSGDMRISFFHVSSGRTEAFEDEFHSRFGEHLVLITTDQLDELRLLGPDPLSEETRRRVGDYTAIALDASIFRYTGGFDEDRFMQQHSHHSGLSAREMTVPMVVG